MEQCEYCPSYKAVMWDLNDGHICMDCFNRRQAIARQKEIDDEREKEANDRAKWEFWHE